MFMLIQIYLSSQDKTNELCPSLYNKHPAGFKTSDSHAAPHAFFSAFSLSFPFDHLPQ